MTKLFLFFCIFNAISVSIFSQKNISEADLMFKNKKYSGSLSFYAKKRKSSPKISNSIYTNPIEYYQKKITMIGSIDSIKKINEQYLNYFGDSCYYFQQKENITNPKSDSISFILKSIWNYCLDNTPLKYYPKTYVITKSDSNFYLLRNKLIEINQKNIFPKNKVQETIDSLDILYLKYGTINADFINQNLKPLFLRKKSNLYLAKMLLGHINNLKLEKDSVYELSNLLVLNKEPSFGGFKKSGVMAMKNQKYSLAIDYFKGALIKTNPDQKNKLDIMFQMAVCQYKNNQKQSAKETLLSIIKIDTSKINIYTTLGDWYLESINDCKNIIVAKQKCMYIAAYNMYVKSKNWQKSIDCKKYFPSVEDLYLAQYKIGQVINTECWMKENVSLQVYKNE